MDDSKQAAEAGSFGIRVRFQAHGLPNAKMSAAVSDMLLEVGKAAVVKRRTLIGHVKAFVETPNGTLRASLVDMDLGVDADDKLEGDVVNEGSMNVMAAVVGLTDHELEGIVEDALSSLGSLMDLEAESRQHGARHEHGAEARQRKRYKGRQ